MTPFEIPVVVTLSATLKELGYSTLSESNPIFAQLFKKDLPVEKLNPSSSALAREDRVAEILALLASDQRGSQVKMERHSYTKSPLPTFDATPATTQKTDGPVQPPIKDKKERRMMSP